MSCGKGVSNCVGADCGVNATAAGSGKNITKNKNTYAYISEFGLGYAVPVHVCIISPKDGTFTSCITTGSFSDVRAPVIINNGFAYVSNLDRVVTLPKGGVYVCKVSTTDGTFSVCQNIFINSPYAMAINGNYAYILKSTGVDKIQVCNLSSTDGTLSGCHDTSNATYTVYAFAINIYNNKVYIADGTTNSITVCNILPNGEFDNSTCKSAANYGDTSNAVMQIAINNGIVYTAALSGKFAFFNILPDGTFTSFGTEQQFDGTPKFGSGIAIYNNYAYVSASYLNPLGGAGDRVYVCPLELNGTFTQANCKPAGSKADNPGGITIVTQ